jgi:hypothetical protein
MPTEYAFSACMHVDTRAETPSPGSPDHVALFFLDHLPDIAPQCVWVVLGAKVIWAGLLNGDAKPSC